MNASADPDSSAHTIAEALNICASEAIHQIASIQPAGLLLAFDPDNLLIRAASKNWLRFFPELTGTIIGRSLADALGTDTVERLQPLLANAPWNGARIWPITLPSDAGFRTHDAQVFWADNLVVIEIEDWHAPNGDVFHDLFIPIRDALWKLDSETDLGCYAQAAVEQVRLLTGFDRVRWAEHNWTTKTPV